jgi:hypothetical protein
VGDLASAFASAYILQTAHQRGLPKSALLRMMANITIDSLLGAIPFAGDLFDVFWKSNRRNAELLRVHLSALPDEQRKLRRSDRLFLLACLAFIAFLTMLSIVAGFYTIRYVRSLVGDGFN